MTRAWQIFSKSKASNSGAAVQAPGRRAPASALSKYREHVATNAQCGSKNQSKSGRPSRFLGVNRSWMARNWLGFTRQLPRRTRFS